MLGLYDSGSFREKDSDQDAEAGYHSVIVQHLRGTTQLLLKCHRYVTVISENPSDPSSDRHPLSAYNLMCRKGLQKEPEMRHHPVEQTHRQ